MFKIMLITVLNLLLVSAYANQTPPILKRISAQPARYEILLIKNNDFTEFINVSGTFQPGNVRQSDKHACCRVELSKTFKENAISWNIEVKPNAGYGVYSVAYPRLFVPAISGGILYYPNSIGMRMSKPFKRRDRKQYILNPHYTSPVNHARRAIYYCRYPYKRQNMQFLLYSNSQSGVMIWTPDATRSIKDFAMSHDLPSALKDKGICAEIIHYPGNTGFAGTAFKNSYPILTTACEGGWYDAMQTYRNWAVKQQWCEKGKIYGRPKTPDWFRNTHIWGAWVMWPDYIAKTRQYEEFFKHLKGFNIGLETFNWSFYHRETTGNPEYFPAHDPDALKHLIDLDKRCWYIAPYFDFEAVAGDFHTFYYVKSMFKRDFLGKAYSYPYPTKFYEHCGNESLFYRDEINRKWNSTSSEEIDRLIKRLDEFPQFQDRRKLRMQNLLRNNWGKEDKRNVIDKVSIDRIITRTCMASPRWRDQCLSDVATLINRFHPKAVYFDEMPYIYVPCFAKDHGHPPGYGDVNLCGENLFLEALAEKSPETVIMVEEGTESVLGNVHFAWYKKANPFTDNVPLWSTVYQGYLEYASAQIYGPFKDLSVEDCVSAMSRVIHLGFAWGGININSNGDIWTLNDWPENNPRVIYMRKCVETRLKYKDYIAAGERLENPEISGAGAIPRIVKWRCTYKGKPEKISMPPVTASKWRKYDNPNKVLILLSNDSEQVQNVQVEGKKVAMQPLSWKGIIITGGK